MSKFQQAVSDNNPAGAHWINFCIGLIHLWIWITYLTFWAESDATKNPFAEEEGWFAYILSSFILHFFKPIFIDVIIILIIINIMR